MFGNSGNTNSRVQNTVTKRFGSQDDQSVFSLLTVNFFSHNSHSLNRVWQFKRNSSRMIFALVLLMAIMTLNKGKHEIKIKSK